MSNANTGYTVIEEYTGASRESMQTTFTVNTPDVSHIQPTIPSSDNRATDSGLLDNPILYEEEPMYDLYGEPLTKDEKMVTDELPAGGATLALPAPSDTTTPTTASTTATTATTTTAATAAKTALPEFSQEYKESLQANAVDTADTKLDNVQLPDEDDPELKEFLVKLEAAKPATTSTYSYGYGGSGYYGGYNYSSNYSNYANSYSNNYASNYKSNYTSSNTNNYDYYNSRQGRNWYSKYYDDDDYEYPSNKSRKVETTESKVTFSDEITKETAKDATKDAKDLAKELEAGDIEVNVKDLKDLTDVMLTKFNTMVKLFTRTLQMVNEVKKSQIDIKKSQIQLSKEIRLLNHQMEYVSKSVTHIRNAFEEGSDDGRSQRYGFDSEDDYPSDDDITKKGKFDNRVPNITHL